MKSGTIETNLREQFLGCRVCAEVVEIPRRLLRDQDALLQMVEDTIRDHRECAEYAKNPPMAKLQREFRKRMERELSVKHDEQPSRTRVRTRCTGR